MNKMIAIIGLGYVGLPLAIEFKKKYKVVGYDIKKKRINDLNKGIDSTKEIKKFSKKNIIFSSSEKSLVSCSVYIVTTPTPVDKENNPNFEFLINATKIISKYIKKGDLVIYESTVHPGATEEICIPIIEKISGLKCSNDSSDSKDIFYCGYSPERINPGDKKKTLLNITKLVSGSSDSALNLVNKLYKSIGIKTFLTDSIQIAEAAKIIENTQRDLNIALINELSIIFNKMKIDTYKVLKAASTKWNFLNFKPGLVGGHCIGVDPYYLTHAVNKIGYQAKLILAGREINNYMPNEIVKRLKLKFKEKKINKKNPKALILGFTFKENCTDIRNTKILDLYQILRRNNFKVDIFDPHACQVEMKKTYNIKKINEIKKNFYDIIIIAVAHDYFLKFKFEEIEKFGKSKKIIFDLKNIFKNNAKIDLRL